MKVILKEEVGNLGLAGDVVDVADGYGRNYLIPRGLAIKAGKGALKEAQTLTRARKTREAKTRGAAEEYKQTLESRKLRIPVRVDEHGTLYGSVGANEIHAILKERGHEVERRRIEVPKAIKEIGDYTVDVRIHTDVVAHLPVEVVDTEGKITIESLKEEDRDATAEGLETLEERALAAAEEVEAEEVEVEETEEAAAADEAMAAEQASVTGAEPTEEASYDSVEDALAAQAAAPSTLEEPTRVEDLLEAETDEPEAEEG